MPYFLCERAPAGGVPKESYLAHPRADMGGPAPGGPVYIYIYIYISLYICVCIYIYIYIYIYILLLLLLLLIMKIMTMIIIVIIMIIIMIIIVQDEGGRPTRSSSSIDVIIIVTINTIITTTTNTIITIIIINILTTTIITIIITTIIRSWVANKETLTLTTTPWIRQQCRKRRMESLACRCFLSYEGVILRVEVPLLAPKP